MSLAEKELARTLSVDLKHALVWVARALDYVGVDDIHHNHRVAYIAYECSKVLGWDAKKSEFCFMAGLIHDCGVSETAEHQHLTSELLPPSVEKHCVQGYHALQNCKLLSQFSNIILHHHTLWRELECVPLTPYEKDVAALIFLADRVDIMRVSAIQGQHEDLVTLYADEITDKLIANRGSVFRPDLVDAMLKLVSKDGFWFSMEPEHIERIPQSFTHLDWLMDGLSLDSILQLGTFIAGIVDAKSPFTYQHSIKVAELAEYVGEKLGLPKPELSMLYVAGLVHDIGKLRTPDHILHKEGKLTPEEYTRIKRHTIDTSIALQMVFPHSQIGLWASNHHERLNGKGYPFNKKAGELDMPSRILAVVDVFQALSQDRPYRGRLDADQIHEIMVEMVNEGQLDPLVYDCLHSHMQECYQLSTDIH
nr:HD-GYP domain-containing protein [Vibrio sonorensis]